MFLHILDEFTDTQCTTVDQLLKRISDLEVEIKTLKNDKTVVERERDKLKTEKLCLGTNLDKVNTSKTAVRKDIQVSNSNSIETSRPSLTGICLSAWK